MRETTKEYMSETQGDFLKKFKKNQWQVYYDKNIAQAVSLAVLYDLRIYACLLIDLSLFNSFYRNTEAFGGL